MSKLAVITGGAYVRAQSQSLSAVAAWRAPHYSTDTDSRNLPVMLLVALAHVAVFLGMLYIPASLPQPPVLSFTVTLMDLSSSQNTVSSAASAPSTPMPSVVPALEPKKSIEKPVIKATTAQKMAKPVPAPVKTDSRLSHHSIAQTAVIAPITPAQFDAAYLHNPKPIYPPQSRRLGEQGHVLLSVHVTEDGRADSVRLMQSSGYSRLDNAAVEAVSKWRFAAAKQGERLIASWVNVPVKFVLE